MNIIKREYIKFPYIYAKVASHICNEFTVSKTGTNETREKRDKMKGKKERGSVRDKDGGTDTERKTETERSESWGQKRSQR